MKLILHIGQPKTGSTSLQNALLDNRRLLRRHGIYYPIPPSRRTNHGALTSLVFEKERWPRQIRHRENLRPGSVVREAKRIVAKLVSTARSKKWQTVLLSSEYFFRDLRDFSGHQIQQTVFSHFSDVTVVAYIRHPASLYLSLCLQSVRHSGATPSPTKGSFRRVLESYADLADLIVRGYDRESLLNGDIVHDFFATCLPMVPIEAVTRSESESNVSMPAEVAAVLQAYRKALYPDEDDVNKAADGRVARMVLSKAQSLGIREGAKLRPEIAAFIERQSRRNIDWLAGEHGILFPSHKTTEQTPARKVKSRPKSLSDVCEIDQDAAERIVMHILRDQARRFPPMGGSLRYYLSRWRRVVRRLPFGP